VDQICLKADAPEAVIREAEAIQTDMAEYPILDEMDCSEREWEACCEYWDGLSPRAKVQDAMYERDKRHWTKGERVWVYGRMSYGDLANYGSEISESLLESIKEGCCY
jgi:diadenosine tetraphosphatase ApaH/serine/threonine PP2A family protein phosphatase